ncbi:hypothetical protein EBB07_12555 [Paenibacillaceae bacterium]|nr:hypothetical protein EBB07_12555 [Paenibacillaceae bacterium]
MTVNEAVILTPGELSNIRNYVRHKYAGLPAERHAEIVADAVQRIIVRQLPVLDEPLKKDVTAALIRSVALKQQRPVHTEDILLACLHAGRGDERSLAVVHGWLNERLQTALPLQQFTELADRHSSVLGQAPAEGETSPLWRELLPMASAWTAGQAVPSVWQQRQRRTLAAVIPLFRPRRRLWQSVGYAGLSVLLVVVAWLYTVSTAPSAITEPGAPPAYVQLVRGMMPDWTHPVQIAEAEKLPDNALPADLQYKAVDDDKVKEYLALRSSLLAEPPYYDAITSAAKAYNIHPLLLFAITGQEQGFVSKSHPDAAQIANNPFNVFHSWKDYNTTIDDSAEIAAKTVLRWSEDRPDHIPAIQWVNRKYAEDPKWSEGVQSIFNAMLRHVTAHSDN